MNSRGQKGRRTPGSPFHQARDNQRRSRRSTPSPREAATEWPIGIPCLATEAQPTGRDDRQESRPGSEIVVSPRFVKMLRSEVGSAFGNPPGWNASCVEFAAEVIHVTSVDRRACSENAALGLYSARLE